MPPNNSSNPTPASPTPVESSSNSTGLSPQYDFIMNSGQQAKPPAKFSVSKMSKPVMILVGVAVVLILVAVGSVILSNLSSKSSKPYVDALSRSTEIVRISDLAKTKMKDADTLALLTTASTVLASEQLQLNSYLKSTGEAINPKLLSGYLNSQSDKSLETAAQNSNLESTYIIYLKSGLSGYLSSLKTAYAGAGTQGKLLITKFIDSTKALLLAPQFSTQWPNRSCVLLGPGLPASLTGRSKR